MKTQNTNEAIGNIVFLHTLGAELAAMGASKARAQIGNGSRHVAADHCCEQAIVHFALALSSRGSNRANFLRVAQTYSDATVQIHSVVKAWSKN